MHCRILLGLIVLLTPAMAEWPLVTSVPALGVPAAGVAASGVATGVAAAGVAASGGG